MAVQPTTQGSRLLECEVKGEVGHSEGQESGASYGILDHGSTRLRGPGFSRAQKTLSHTTVQLCVGVRAPSLEVCK